MPLDDPLEPGIGLEPCGVMVPGVVLPLPMPDVPVPDVPVPLVPAPEVPLDPEVPLEPWVAQSLFSEPVPLLPVAELPEPDMPLEEAVLPDCREAQSTLPCAPDVPGVDVAPAAPLPDAPLPLEDPLDGVAAVPPEPMEPDVPLAEFPLAPLVVPLAPLLPLPEGHVPEGHDWAVEIPACASIRMKSAEEIFFMLPPSREMNERMPAARSMPIVSKNFDKEEGNRFAVIARSSAMTRVGFTKPCKLASPKTFQ